MNDFQVDYCLDIVYHVLSRVERLDPQPKGATPTQTASLNPAMSLADLVELDRSIGHQINDTDPATDPDGARLLLRQRRWVRSQIDTRKAAQSN
jgi:hypothetical protein